MSFDDAILAGTTLVRDDIRSEGYVAGTTGWIIKRNGDCELNDAVVRGRLEIGDPDVSGLVIETNAFGNPVIEWYAGGSYQQSQSYITAEDAVVQVTNGGGISVLHRNNEYVFRKDSTGVGVLFDRTTGFFMYFSDDTNYVEEGWLAPTYANGWGGADPGYRLMPDGTVRLRGHISGGTVTPGTAMFTLPVGYRPTQEGYFTVSMPNNNTQQGTVRVRTTGQVDCIFAAGGVASLSLDQVSFAVI